MSKLILSAQDHINISQAIREAEAGTAGEIYCVLARSSGSYVFPALALSSMALIIASLAVAIFLHIYWIDPSLMHFVGMQAVALIIIWALIWCVKPLRLWLVPAPYLYRHAHANALTQFMSRNIHTTPERTGLLLFISLEEHYATVIADVKINDKVGQEEWNAIVSALVDGARRDHVAEGFVRAIALAGALLARHVPKGENDPNSLPDRLVEL
ncbi:TPM domain-containing protein [Limoniibacter endophyticus]|uniref:TPM domain-containing protein n=1 Tax=Limoniibacter endophyticus TaxID=1565040 RepID=A0A8J3GGM3_9HYPH|nr:TPM domain-containing protein [Limoniibacter endophyticus]GHC73925.1 hypothetical protein GCM10010136_22530 [Limoniibacter endophyticus]